MNTLYLDSSALRNWSDCRELFRYTQRERIAPVKPSVYYEFGIAIHLMVESFWRGETEDQARECAYAHTNTFPVDMLAPRELDTWERMVKGTPDLTAAYFAAVEYQPEQLLWVEKEWSLPYDPSGLAGGGSGSTDAGSRSSNGDGLQVVLCGRMDRLMAGPRIVDVKTASEISGPGQSWAAQYRQDKILDMQFALYDWYLCQICSCGHSKDDHAGYCLACSIWLDGHKDSIQTPGVCSGFKSMAPIEIYLEVLLKPYKLKPSRYEKIDLTILTTPAYRKRFAQQLKWKVSEIVHYVEHYSQQRPWPLAGGLACSSKYGKCAYMDLCTWGDSPKIMEDFEKRTPHLQIMQSERGSSANQAKP